MNRSKSDETALPDPPTWGDYLRALPQYLYPKRLLSALMFRATRIRFAFWKNWQIRWFIRRYGVDMDIAAQADMDAYADFNDFFTRALLPDARPLPADEDTLISPADGALHDFGRVIEGSLIQAKARRYTVADLLGDPSRGAGPFLNGSYLTIYLSPKDYHRVHMPVSGSLVEMVYVPGNLFSVNPATARGVPRLFARNERMVARFQTELGAMAVVMVGAVFVGGIETVWHGTVTPARSRRVSHWRYGAEGERPWTIARGAELGRFNMGSTVVVLLERGGLEWRADLAAGTCVNMGEALAGYEAGGSSLD
jgi:phosphatidylserine decarboxylase